MIVVKLTPFALEEHDERTEPSRCFRGMRTTDEVNQTEFEVRLGKSSSLGLQRLKAGVRGISDDGIVMA